jgi:hypothetical protein
MGKYCRYLFIKLYRENANSIYIDLLYDESSFLKKFEVIEAENFETNDQKVP